MRRIYISWIICIAVGIAIGVTVGMAVRANAAQADSEISVCMQVEVTQETTTKKADCYISLGEFRITAYCSCEKCCGKWADNRPTDESGQEIVYTASGKTAIEGMTIAADTDILPFGSTVIIDGHEYTVQDRGSAIKGKCIDIYFESHKQAVEFGVKYKEVLIKKG